LTYGVTSLKEGLQFKYREFKLTRHDYLRISTTLDALVKENKLIKGKWKKKNWLGMNILEKLCRAWMRAGLEEGCRSWDIHLHRHLSIVLLSSLGCRAGQVTLSKGYDKEYMSWKHIIIKLGPGGSTVDDLEADITLAFEKGKK
jgi:hypothetical protein